MTKEENAALDDQAKKKQPNKHLQRIDHEIRDLKSKLCESMYVDDIDAATKLMGDLRNEPHVQMLRPIRQELEFLCKRREQIEATNG